MGGQAGLNIADKLPPDAGQIEVIPADDLSGARQVVNLIEKLALWLTLLALILFAVAIYLARGWRREALRAVGFAFIVVGIAIAAARSFAGELRRGHAGLHGRRQAGRDQHLRHRNLPARPTARGRWSSTES